VWRDPIFSSIATSALTSLWLKSRSTQGSKTSEVAVVYALARFSGRTRRVRPGGFESAPRAVGSPAASLSFFSLFGAPNKAGR
jgi:hypothetical protein